MSSPVEPTDSITQLGEVLATAERHVQEIVAAAEDRANERLRDAQAQLDARAAELNAIADELLTASAAVHHQIQRLRSLGPLDELAAERPSLPEEPPLARAPIPVTAPVAVTAPVPVTTHDDDLPIIGGSDHVPTPASTDELDSARLVALSMAASGRSRSEVETHLRRELGITDHGPLIDYVFGISTPASVVPSWPPRRRRRSG